MSATGVDVGDTSGVQPSTPDRGTVPPLFWMAVAVVQGAVLTLGLVPVWESNGRVDVILVFGGFAFVLSGMLLGYRSEGSSSADALVGGGALALVVGTAVAALGYAPPAEAWVLAPAGGVFLSWIGGLVGLRLRSVVVRREPDDPTISWAWVAVGTVIGVVLNGSAAFVVSALFDLSGAGLAGSFALSFLVTGAFVGYHAPGHTPRDSVAVGATVVTIDALLVLGVFGVPFPPLAVFGAALTGFSLVLAGGWAGDFAYRLRHRIG